MPFSFPPLSSEFNVFLFDELVKEEEDQQHDESQDDAHRSAASGAAFRNALAAEYDVEHIDDRRDGRHLGIDRAEHFGPEEEDNRVDGPEGDVRLENALEQGKGDMEELADFVLSVDRRGLVQIRRNALDAGEENQHIVADRAENERDEHRPEFHLAVEPVKLLAAEGGNDGVEKTTANSRLTARVMTPPKNQIFAMFSIDFQNTGWENRLA